MNLALDVTDDLVGSRVAFESGFVASAGAEGCAERARPLWLDHAPAHGFVNLCQHRHGVEPLVRGGRDTLVVRGFAASFRRAPAETWVEQCLP